MGALIIGVVLAVLVILVMLWRARFMAHDATVLCPDAETLVEIRGGVCRELKSRRVVGIASLCHRRCLMSRRADARYAAAGRLPTD
jgi:hypothetical protein